MTTGRAGANCPATGPLPRDQLPPCSQASPLAAAPGRCCGRRPRWSRRDCSSLTPENRRSSKTHPIRLPLARRTTKQPNAGVKLHGGLGAGPMRSSVLDGAWAATMAGREPCQLERLVRQPLGCTRGLVPEMCSRCHTARRPARADSRLQVPGVTHPNRTRRLGAARPLIRRFLSTSRATHGARASDYSSRTLDFLQRRQRSYVPRHPRRQQQGRSAPLLP